MGLEMGGKTPSERTLRDFEKFLQQRHGDTQVPRYLLLHEYIVRVCLETGVVDPRAARWVMDSTPMWCFGAVRDTVRLLGDGLRSLAALWARATRTTLEKVADDWQMPWLLQKSTKGAFRIDWNDPMARATVITQLGQSVIKGVDAIRRDLEGPSVRRSMRKGLLRRCRHLLRVVEQDLDAGPNGQLVVAKRVAADRLICLTDPQARHGRKTKSETFDGFKIHLLGDAVSGLILSLSVTSGNAHDSQPAHRLIRRARALHADLERVLADTAYGGARFRHVTRRSLGVTLIAPPPPVDEKKGKLRKANFVIDFERAQATCPNGITSEDMRSFWSSEHNTHASLFVWPKSTCDRCPLSDTCRGKETGSRRLVLHPYEQDLRRAREEWEDPKLREAYRTRTQGERLINEVIRHGGRQARAFGLKAAQLQAHAIAMACNLRLLAQALAAQEQEKLKPQKRAA
jgi:hypothetical protein